jgi:large subunit ribosomal protein L9
MKVILQEDVANLGATGTVHDVADGYGRNFLLPRNLAVLADERNSHRLAHQTRQAAQRQAKVLAGAKELGAKISALSLSIKRKAGDEDKLFGSVTNQDIASALGEQGITVERRSIVLADPIRAIGVYQVSVKVHRDVEASVKVYVTRA